MSKERKLLDRSGLHTDTGLGLLRIASGLYLSGARYLQGHRAGGFSRDDGELSSFPAAASRLAV